MKNKHATAFPLQWPEGWARNTRPASSQFKTTLAAALNNVEKAIAMFAKDSGKKVENVLISSNVTLGTMRPNDAGVAIYFSWDGLSTAIAVDRYAKVEDNLQAIYHCIEAERTKLRHGGINLVRAAFRGYAALPPPDINSNRPWREVLGYGGNNIKDAERAYRRCVSKLHPDKGGDKDAFHIAQMAWEAAQKELGAA